MDRTQAEQLLARLEAVSSCDKTFDATEKWVEIHEREAGRLIFRVALRLNGVLGGGVYARLTTPKLGWDEDVYGHLEVQRLDHRSCLRLLPIEWRPYSPHQNTGAAPSHLRLLSIEDRWHPFDLNKPLGIEVFQQTKTGVAAPFPRAINSFQEYLDFCADVWKCPDVRSIPVPPWSKLLV